MIEQFKYARVGDKVFSVRHGWGVIKKICYKHHPDGIKVHFTQTGNNLYYHVDGRYGESDLYPELYHQEPWVCYNATRHNRIAFTQTERVKWSSQFWVKEPEKPKDEIKILVNGKEVEISADTLASIRGAMEQSDG